MSSTATERKDKTKYKNRHFVDVREGHNVTLECKGDGIPKPMIHWVILSSAFCCMSHICHHQNAITLYFVCYRIISLWFRFYMVKPKC